MPKLLCIETSTEVCSVCCGDENGTFYLSEIDRKNSHTETITLQIEKCMDSCGWVYHDLEAVAVGAGPGSYTGLRVGTSAAKGIAFGMDIPLISISSLQALAQEFLNYPEPVDLILPMIDARRMEVYAAIYNSQLEQLVGTHSLILDSHSFDSLDEELKLLVCGNGAIKMQNIQFSRDIRILPSKCSAKNLLPLAIEAYRKEKFENLENYDPDYFKHPNVTKSKKKIF
jgi:tRNA threonylcarbamoyladenosine biosynthesis protein TsaB